MSNNHFRRGELYSVINGMASTAVARRLQKNFRSAGLEITIEQWSVLYHLWKEDGLSQQELCNRTFRDKPSITRLIDNLEKQKLVKRVASPTDRRINLAWLLFLRLAHRFRYLVPLNHKLLSTLHWLA